MDETPTDRASVKATAAATLVVASFALAGLVGPGSSQASADPIWCANMEPGDDSCVIWCGGDTQCPVYCEENNPPWNDRCSYEVPGDQPEIR